MHPISVSLFVALESHLGFACPFSVREKVLTSYQETNTSAHLGKRRKQHHVRSNSRCDLHSPKALYRCFREHVLRLHQTVIPGQPDGLSKEACLHAVADRLSLSVGQRVAREVNSAGASVAANCLLPLSSGCKDSPQSSRLHVSPEHVSFACPSPAPPVFCFCFVFCLFVFVVLFVCCCCFGGREGGGGEVGAGEGRDSRVGNIAFKAVFQIFARSVLISSALKELKPYNSQLPPYPGVVRADDRLSPPTPAFQNRGFDAG